MTQCATTETLIAAFRDYLSWQTDAKKLEMLQALEDGQNISFGYGAKVSLSSDKKSPKKTISRIKRKKPAVKPEISEDACKIASVSVLINMDGLNKQTMRHVSKVLKSERHHLKLYDVDVRGKSGIAKAYVYEKRNVVRAHLKQNVNPLLSKTDEQFEMAAPNKVEKLQNKLPKWMRSTHSSSGRGMRKRQKMMAGIERKLAVFLKENGETKDKDPP